MFSGQTTSEEILKRLKVHDGFEGSVFARNIGNARMIVVADDGDATRGKGGRFKPPLGGLRP
ncbi:hypothetical protein ACDY96_34540 [Rhizobium mongolense]|uniref:hypothetical protein n=1 Tax=Rhizobium TaxID=379 RepID=UPI00188FCAA8|nr:MULTISPECIES: hypothetical protein [unclassified Rhizobium]QPB22636.1 hypothetical protein ISN39_23890 [Rhizobium sp. 007]WFU90267.1 hypothetical protein QA644_30210 [Rhizobium sp. CC1099]